MARRRNAIFHRLSRMRGLPPDEKMLMQRIGHLMDAALNNRQASNPYGPSKNNPDRVLYPPTGLIAYTGYRTLKLTWKAANSDQHLLYEIKITNNDTGESEVKTSYTNELRYKNVNGTYTAVVKSVGRDTSSSPAATIEFTMGGSVMQIEGAKNGPTELGTIVQDEITLYDDYSVYAWGSVVLDKYAAGVSNEQMVFRLWSMPGIDRVFDADVATLQQTITMYPATESFSNLDDQAHAALITRPVAARAGSFETSQSVMFSPISVDTSEESVTFTFFLQAVGRETELDEVNLSLVLWGGFDGLGDNVPQDPWDGGTPGYVFPHLNSLRLLRREMNPVAPYDTVTSGSWYMAQQSKLYNIIDNAWTLAFWVRLETNHTEIMIEQGSDLDNAKLAAENIIFRRSSYSTNAPGYSWTENAIQVSMLAYRDTSIGGLPGEAQHRQQLIVTVWPEDGLNEISTRFDTPVFGDHIANHTPGDDDGNSYLWGGREEEFTLNYNWQFVVICYEGGPGGFGYGGTSLTPKIRVYTSDRHSDASNPDEYDAGAGGVPSNKMECLNQRVADGALITYQVQNLLEECNQDLTNDYIYTIGMGPPTPFFSLGVYQGSHLKTNNGTFNIHQMGMWNVAIDNWDGMGFNVGNAEQRDSSPMYAVPVQTPLTDNPRHTDGRHNPYSGSSLTAIHYLYNQGYGTAVDWKKNSLPRIDNALEYIFAENLIHLWQFGAVVDGEFSTTSEALRDTGNFLYGGDVNFLRTITAEVAAGVSANAWSDDCKVSDILSQTRPNVDDPWTEAALRNIAANVADSTWDQIAARLPPVEWKIDGLPNGPAQQGLVQPAGHINAAGYPDGGTTASSYAYPGQGLTFSGAGGGGDWSDVGWRIPNATDGVLDEWALEKSYKSGGLSSDWKSYGPVHTSQGRPAIPPPTAQAARTGLEQAVSDH